MNILFYHNIGETVDDNDPNVIALKKVATVYQSVIDYSLAPNDLLDELCNEIFHYRHIDYIVGIGMGAWLASHVATRYDIPFLACNPVYNPATTYLDNEDYVECEIFNMNGHDDSMLFFDSCDDFIDQTNDPEMTSLFVDQYPVIVFGGGSDHFEHMEDVLKYIRATSEAA